MVQLSLVLDNYIDRLASKFRVQGWEMASSLCAATFDFGDPIAFLTAAFQVQSDQRNADAEAYQSFHDQEEPPLENPRASMKAYWASIDDSTTPIRAYSHTLRDSISRDAPFPGSDCVAAYACYYLGQTTSVVARRIGDKNILPYMHVILVYLFGLSFVPNALLYVEGCVPWGDIEIFLNSLIGRSDVVDAGFEGTEFPQQLSGTGWQLPEDFAIRGLIWAQHYFPSSHAAPRAERCLWLGVQLASVSYHLLLCGDELATNLPYLA
jgi:hypothetical protein